MKTKIYKIRHHDGLSMTVTEPTRTVALLRSLLMRIGVPVKISDEQLSQWSAAERS